MAPCCFGTLCIITMAAVSACGASESVSTAQPTTSPESSVAAPTPTAQVVPKSSFPARDPSAEGIDTTALGKLMARAVESKSDAIIILKNGKLVTESYFDKPRTKIEAMSATKSIVNLAIGKLLQSRKIKSLDQPVSDFFPEWKQGGKKDITIRHLLNHTSGLQNERTSTAVEIYPSPDFVQLALAADLSHSPGKRFSYNNKAVNLLAGVVKAATGKRLDVFLGEAVFTPMGITDFSWTLDEAGNPHAMSGLQIHAMDLAKIGQMLADGGRWRGQQIVDESWITQSTKPGQTMSPNCGLLWWLLPEWTKLTISEANIDEWREAGVEAAFIKKVLPMKGQLYTRKEFFGALTKIFGGKKGIETWYDNTWRRALPDGATVVGPIEGYYAEGYLGQYLVVLPKQGLVAVRQMRSPGDGDHKKLDTFREFKDMVRDLVATELPVQPTK